MECNKDEAIRAKVIAENKLMEMDVAGAEKFALKAQNLYPELDGLPQFLDVLNVHTSFDRKINGEIVDWYGVLGVEPSADENAIRKHYRKLALILHPDKNKSVGADGAFQIVSQAWTLLSDRSKRFTYDQTRGLPRSWQSSARPGQNGFQSFANGKSGTFHHAEPSTFWTICVTCIMNFEYSRCYLNQTLMCPNCRKSFLAVEMPAPPFKDRNVFPAFTSRNKPRYASKWKPHSAANVGLAGFSGLWSSKTSNFQSAPKSATASSGVAPTPASSTSGGFRSIFEQLNRKREEAPPAATLGETLKKKNPSFGLATGSSSTSYTTKKRKLVDEQGLSSNRAEMSNQTERGNGGVGMGSFFVFPKGNLETGRVNGVNNKPDITRELTQREIRNVFMHKAKKEIQNKFDQMRTAAATKTSDETNDPGKENEQRKEKGNEKSAANNCSKFVDTKNEDHTKKSSPSNSGLNGDPKSSDAILMSVQDPDFHDFDMDRTEMSFGANQVWAAYDDDDGMPRFYAMIHRVISFKPFKVQISWLNSKSNDDLAPINWIVSGFSKTCGDFWVGKHEVNKSLNSFSHKIKWTKGARGSIQIFPKKGDVWALYRNWSPDWDAYIEAEVMHKYDMVEVLEDYTEQGVTIAPLVKVSGFKTVFRMHSDPREVRKIPKEEMFRFSHQVPCNFLTGQEGPNAPKGCRELDPASLPSELLQVSVDINEGEMANNAAQAKQSAEEVLSGGEKESKEEEPVITSKTSKGKDILAENQKNVVAQVKIEKGKEPEVLKVYRRRQARKC